MPSLNLADLGVRSLGPADDPTAFWRATFLGGAMTSSTSFAFDEEPEHRAIETIMQDLGASSVRSPRRSRRRWSPRSKPGSGSSRSLAGSRRTSRTTPTGSPTS